MEVIEKLSFPDYCLLDRANSSSLKLLKKSPAHLKAARNEPQSDKAEMLIGHASHTAILEPELFHVSYSVFPDNLTKTTKEGKAEWARIESLGLPILRQKQWDTAVALSQAVAEHATASTLLYGGKFELTLLCELQGIPVKSRLDCLNHGKIIDVKTTEDASASGFSRSIYSYQYHLQAAFYLDCAAACGIEVDGFVFIAIEKEPPFAISIFELDAEAIDIGRSDYMRALQIYADCDAFDYWPGYPGHVQSISLPYWAMKAA